MEAATTNDRVLLITGTRKGIGKYLAEHYLGQGNRVIGCSRGPSSVEHDNYRHFQLDVTDEPEVVEMFRSISNTEDRLDVLINNAGIASMNHLLLTPVKAVQNIFATNFVGTFLLCREAAKVMKRRQFGRIVNFTSVATPLKLEGEAVYAASKAAVVSFTQITAKELAPFNITVNAIGPTPIQTDLIRSVPPEKIEKIIKTQPIQRLGEMKDVANVVDFFIQPASDFITGQVIYLGGV